MNVERTGVVIVGAGMAGLTAARKLTDHGHDVVVLDKGRAVGGRMATRRLGDARFDHGAQHFSVRTEAFTAEVAGWVEAGVADVWFRSASLTQPERGVESRHRGVNGMRGIPEFLAAGMDVRTEVLVDEVVPDDGGVLVVSGDEGWSARAAIVTAPVPQLLDLVRFDGRADLRDSLQRVRYDPCLAVMAELDGDSGLTEGHASVSRGPVAWLGDNHHKGVSGVPAITIHSTPSFARHHLEDPPEVWVPLLVGAAGSLVDAEVTGTRGHRWRYAQPVDTFDSGCAVVDTRLVLAGEVFAGAKVEGAFLSGGAAADAILERSIG